MKILILGAAGQIAVKLTDLLLEETDINLVLYARHVEQRITRQDHRVNVISGDFLEKEKLILAMKDIDAVYLNDMGNTEAVKIIVEAMQEVGIKRFIGASILGIYDEVVGKFGEWNHAMIGTSPRMQAQKDSAKVVEESNLDYILLRLTWLYNQPKNEAYALSLKGTPFKGAQVTREAVARLIADLLTGKISYDKESLGVYEPGTELFPKPTFY